MVKLNKIYTKTGDDGTTGLVSGPRRLKHDLRVESYGTIDETNSAIGIARLHSHALPLVDMMLMAIQNDLFDLGADLSTPETDEPPAWEPLRIVATQVDRLERDIDSLNAELQPLTSFVLPGGHPAAAHLHLARTIARRAERLMVALSRTEDERVGAPALHYVNRLSDFLFVAARYANDLGRADVLWVPGKNR
jgi:cob(I)alamin adenosyltransferase